MPLSAAVEYHLRYSFALLISSVRSNAASYECLHSGTGPIWELDRRHCTQRQPCCSCWLHLGACNLWHTHHVIRASRHRVVHHSSSQQSCRHGIHITMPSLAAIALQHYHRTAIDFLYLWSVQVLSGDDGAMRRNVLVYKLRAQDSAVLDLYPQLQALADCFGAPPLDTLCVLPPSCSVLDAM